MVSSLDRARRALISLLRELAALYKLVLDVTRDSNDKQVVSAYRKVSLTKGWTSQKKVLQLKGHFENPAE